MKYKCRAIISVCITLYMFLFLCDIDDVFGDIDKKDDEVNVLVISSYYGYSKWEKGVLEGFTDSDELGVNLINVSLYFDGIEGIAEKTYVDSVNKMIHEKYGEKYIDCIVTLDDESFMFARANLFNEDSVIYKKPIVFLGVNFDINLNEDEKHYISGIIDDTDEVGAINLILDSDKHIENIYLVAGESKYAEAMASKMPFFRKFANRDYEFKIIQDSRLGNIEEQLEDISDKDSAILLVGKFVDDVGVVMESKSVISSIQSKSDVPIYSTAQSYVEGGAIGGVVGNPYKSGKVLAEMVESVLNHGDIHISLNPDNKLSVPIVNFRALREYGINPLLLPKDSVVMNKRSYELMVPLYIQNILWISAALIIMVVFYMIYRHMREMRYARYIVDKAMYSEKVRSDFIVAISHEFRTPINVISSCLKLLEVIVDRDDYEKEYILEKFSLMKKNSNRLLKQVNNLIDASELDNGYLKLCLNNYNIVEVVEDSVGTIINFAKSKGIEVVFDSEEEEIILAIDKNKIERVILNLLSNSVKYIGDGSNIFVMVSIPNVTEDERYVSISVKDDGIGISKDIVDLVFEKFKRGDIDNGLIRECEGSGLGLYIVRRIVELHNGEINIISEVGKGTEVIFKLPLYTIEGDSSGVLATDMSSVDYKADIEFSDLN